MRKDILAIRWVLDEIGAAAGFVDGRLNVWLPLVPDEKTNVKSVNLLLAMMKRRKYECDKVELNSMWHCAKNNKRMALHLLPLEKGHAVSNLFERYGSAQDFRYPNIRIKTKKVSRSTFDSKSAETLVHAKTMRFDMHYPTSPSMSYGTLADGRFEVVTKYTIYSYNPRDGSVTDRIVRSSWGVRAPDPILDSVPISARTEALYRRYLESKNQKRANGRVISDLRGGLYVVMSENKSISGGRYFQMDHYKHVKNMGPILEAAIPNKLGGDVHDLIAGYSSDPPSDYSGYIKGVTYNPRWGIDFNAIQLRLGL